MKNYHEMIQYVSDQIENGTLRYEGWVVAMLLSESYGVTRKTVQEDLEFEKTLRWEKKKEQRRAESRAAHEQRRLANLASKSAS
jgi:hypothetical protein